METGGVIFTSFACSRGTQGFNDIRGNEQGDRDIEIKRGNWVEEGFAHTEETKVSLTS